MKAEKMEAAIGQRMSRPRRTITRNSRGICAADDSRPQTVHFCKEIAVFYVTI